MKKENPVTYERMGTSLDWIKKLIFAGIFIQENKLHAIFDRYNEMSSKQWLLMAVSASFDAPPVLTTLAGAMGCSRQNVKKLAVNLEKVGYIKLEKSDADARALCVKMTAKGMKFAEYMADVTDDVHAAMFGEFTEEEIRKYYQLSIKLMHGINHLEAYFQNQRKGEAGRFPAKEAHLYSRTWGSRIRKIWRRQSGSRYPSGMAEGVNQWLILFP